MKIFGRQFYFTKSDVAYFAAFAFLAGSFLGVQLALA